MWHQPVPFDEAAPVPTPTPTPTPQPVPACQVTPELISALQASQAAILEALQRQAEQTDELKTLVQQVLAQPAPKVTHPPYRLRVLGQQVTATPVLE